MADAQNGWYWKIGYIFVLECHTESKETSLVIFSHSETIQKLQAIDSYLLTNRWHCAKTNNLMVVVTNIKFG